MILILDVSSLITDHLFPFIIGVLLARLLREFAVVTTTSILAPNDGTIVVTDLPFVSNLHWLY